MKPTEYDYYNIEDNHGPVVRPAAFLQDLEEQGFELVQRTDGMCYVEGKWQMLEKAGPIHAGGHDCKTMGCADLYRLIPLQEEM